MADKRKYTYKYYRAEVADGIPDTKKYAGVEEVDGQYWKTALDGGRRQIIFAEDIRDFVADFYDNPETGYFGRDKLYARISEHFDGVSRREVAAVLASMETQQIHSIPPNVTINRPITPKRPRQQLAADLVSITNGDNEPLFTLLTVVDVFTKFAWVRKVKSKSAAVVAAAMESILDDAGEQPGALLTDRGTEFKGAFDILLEDREIKHLLTEAYSPRQNSMVERFNRTIKTLINKYLTHAKGVTISDHDLAALVKNYNTAIHATTKIAPANAADSKQTIATTRANIKQRAERLIAKNTRTFPEIVVGDTVRIARRTGSEWRKLTKLKKYSYQRQYWSELYRVVSKTTPSPTKAEHYRVRDESGRIPPRLFLRADLLKIDRDILLVEMPEGTYAVEQVLDVRGQGAKKEYLIAWRGHSNKTWEPYDESFAAAIADFES